MKCERARRLILLACTSEIGAWSRSVLQRHVEKCSTCRSFLRSSQGVTELIRLGLPVERPDALTLARIRLAAEAAADERRGIRQRLLAPALAFAALAVVMLGSGLLLYGWDPRSRRIEEIKSIVTLVHESDLRSSETAAADEVSDALFSLGQQLLQWEGLHLGPSEEDWFTLDEGLSPTALQWQSIRGLFWKICG